MITPSDTPAAPGNYGGVTPTGVGARPAPYDIQAPQADLSGVFGAAGALTAGQENSIYGTGLRQQETATLMQSPQGFAVSGYDIDAGWSGGGGDTGWPNNVEPPGM